MNLREKIIKHFDTVETVFLLIFAATFITVLKEIEYSKYIFGAGSFLMAIPYWFKATYRKQGDKKLNFRQKISWYGLMITPIAIYSKVIMEKNSNLFLLLTIALLFVALVFKVLDKINNTENIQTADIIRIIAGIIISFSIFALPLPNIN